MTSIFAGPTITISHSQTYSEKPSPDDVITTGIESIPTADYNNFATCLLRTFLTTIVMTIKKCAADSSGEEKKEVDLHSIQRGYIQCYLSRTMSAVSVKYHVTHSK